MDHAHFHFCFPFCAAVYLTPDLDERRRLCKQLADVADAIVCAEAVRPKSTQLEECIWDVSWHREQLASVLVQHGLKTKFDPEDAEMRQFLARLFASTSSAKELLESNFNNMARQLNYMNTNQKCSDEIRVCHSSRTARPAVPGRGEPCPQPVCGGHCVLGE